MVFLESILYIPDVARSRRILAYILLSLCLFSPALKAQFYSLETKDLRLIYFGKSQEYLVKYIAQCFENSARFHHRLFAFTPSEKVTVLLQDFSDYGNAGAGTLPKDHIVVAIAPLNTVYETSPANERMNTTMNHEMVHIVTSDKASGADRFYRTLFVGKVSPSSEDAVSMVYSYMTAPRRYAPRWYAEGIAVFLETWMAGGIGRAQGGYDEMVFRTMVRDSSRIYDLVGLESEGTKIDFQVGVNSYLYGTRFMSYLAYVYGPERLIQWVSRTDSSDAYFAAQFESVYGLPLGEAWSHWITWEHGFQKENLDSLRVSPVTPYRSLSRRALGSVSRCFFDPARRSLYAALNYPGQVPRIASLNVDTGNDERICDIKGAALFYVSSIAYDDSSHTLFYTTDNNEWRDLNAVNVVSGKSGTLIKDARVGDLAFNRADKSLWGVRHDGGISTLVRIPFPYSDWNQIHTWDYGKDMFDMDISPDGTSLVAAMVDISGRQRLIRMDTGRLLRGDASYDTLFDFESSSPEDFTFSPDGRYLFGSSYYTGVSNIYRYDFRTKSMDIVTNCESGFFRPVPLSDDSLIVLRYTGEGFVPVTIPGRPVDHVGAITFLGQKIAAHYPIIRRWVAEPPSSVRIDSLTTYEGEYSTLENIGVTALYPIVQGYKVYTAVGMRLNAADPIGLQNASVKVAYSPGSRLARNERLHASGEYSYMEWKVRATYNDADFYDLFGPTRTSRKGYSLETVYRKSLILDDPKNLEYTIAVAGYTGLDRLPEYQNVASSFDKLLTADLRLRYKDLEASLGAVDYEKGDQWDLRWTNEYVNTKLYPLFSAGFDLGIPLGLDHSAVWFRSSAGYSPGRREEPAANFYFGGFGNNWVDYRPEKRYREQISFPGVGLNEISGTNYGKLMMEWVLPPLRFSGLGTAAMYCPWARLALFTTGISTNMESRELRQTVFDVGAQIDFRLIILSNLNATLSFGYATAGEHGMHRSDEYMVSLKIM